MVQNDNLGYSKMALNDGSEDFMSTIAAPDRSPATSSRSASR